MQFTFFVIGRSNWIDNVFKFFFRDVFVFRWRFGYTRQPNDTPHNSHQAYKQTCNDMYHFYVICELSVVDVIVYR